MNIYKIIINAPIIYKPVYYIVTTSNNVKKTTIIETNVYNRSVYLRIIKFYT